MQKKFAIIIMAAAAVAACSDGQSSVSAEEFVETAIIEACEKLVADYAIFRDRPDPEGYSNTFADDGELVLPSGTYSGREALRHRLAEGAGKSVSRHMMSTSRIIVQDSRHATGISYAMIFIEETPDGEETEFPVATDGIFAIGEYHDTFELTNRGWKFTRREFRPVLQWDDGEQ